MPRAPKMPAPFLWYPSGIYDTLARMSALLSTIALRSDSGVPYCDQLYAEVKARIIAGTLPVGHALPAERELVRVWGIARTTLRRAFGRLEAEGFVQRRRGVGSFVADSRRWKRASRERLGIVVWDVTQTGHYKEMFGHVCAEAAMQGVQVQTLHVGTSGSGRSIEEPAAEARVDGLIIMPGAARPHLEQLAAVRRPVVVMEMHLTQQGLDHVLIDSFQGVYDGVRELIRLGHRDIAYVGGLLAGPPRQGRAAAQAPALKLAQDSYSRCLAYRSALEDAGLAFRQDRYFELPYESDPVLAWVRHFRRSCPTLTAVVAFSDSLALLLVEACQAQGVRVPHDLSVLGFGNGVPEARAGQLATCAFDVERMARLGVQRVLERIRHGALGGVGLAVPSTFKPGASIGPPRAMPSRRRRKST